MQDSLCLKIMVFHFNVDHIMKKLEQILNQFTLFIGDKVATKTEIDKFILFVKELKTSRRVHFIYRGNSDIFKNYGIGSENISLLTNYIFCLGDKGRYFLHDKISKAENIFSFIWNRFHDKVCGLNFNSECTKERVLMFLASNPEFYQYFSDVHNKKHFDSLLQLSVKESNKVVDYYLFILHTIGKSANGMSYFLSSTTIRSVAETFKGDNNIVIYGWMPKKGANRRKIKYVEANKYHSFVKSLELPTHQVSVYPEQKEICIKCGLLPNYIIGFQHNNDFYINPNIIKEQWHDNIVYDGLDIDQKEFDDFFKKSKYKQSFIYCDGDYYLISKNGVTEV